MTNLKNRAKAKRPVGRPRANARDKFPICTNIPAAHAVTGIPILEIWRLRDYGLTTAFRHGKIYTGELLRDYRKNLH